MKEIPLTRGKVAIIDDQDYERVSAFRWHAVKSSHREAWAAASYDPQQYDPAARRQTKIKMHRFIMNAPDGLQVDHKNGDGLDNRRDNLRLATNTQNQQNRRLGRNNLTGYKGVTFHKNRNLKRRYETRVCRDGRLIHVGSFLTAEEAARAYDAKAKEMYGEFARLNFD